ncbi:MAG: PIG-L deacetylase family protein [Sutterellaceae bacterium]|nr:PIG-L family deacetylase [Burkholderiaceae bacterium]MDW8429575.1 PIG-L deacetylase family protein [Sutterellaceae bacterium]
MLDIVLSLPRAPGTILLLGAHSDDIEIGCGGSLLRMAAAWPQARFHWITLSADAQRAAETRAAASRLLAGRMVDITVKDFRGSYFPYEGAAIKDYFEMLKPLAPDLIFTHCRHDLHQDHRVVHELTWNTFRDHLILEYEIPKFDGDLGTPNVFVTLSREQLRQKIEILLDCFPSQRSRQWFTRETFEALARLRGIECNAPEGFAEAFFARKLRLAIP